MRKVKLISALVLAGMLALTGCADNQNVATNETAQTETKVEAEVETSVAELKTETIAEAGTYTGEYEGIVITAADTVLENVIAEKIVVAKEVGDGDVTFKNVQAATLEVYGGGANSIHLESSTVENVISHKEEGIVRIVVENETNVASFDSTNTLIVVKKGADVTDVTANANTEVVIEEEAKTQSITVAAETASVSVAGEVTTVAVAAPKASVVVEETAKVAEVKVEEVAVEAKVVVTGTVEKVAVTAAKTEVKVEETAKVSEVKVEEKAADTKVTVNGTVDKVATQAVIKVEGTGKVEAIDTEKEELVEVSQGATATQNTQVTVKPIESAPAATPAPTPQAPAATPTPTPAPQTPVPTPVPQAPAATPAPTPQAPAHVHSYTSSTKDATCTASGSISYVCTGCYDAYSEDIPAKGHTATTLAAVAPTCTTTGLTAGTKCTTCNEVLTAQATVAALGHKEVVDAGKAATCTEAGLTEGKHCSVCNTVLVEQTVVNALGHNMNDANNECTVCHKYFLNGNEVSYPLTLVTEGDYAGLYLNAKDSNDTTMYIADEDSMFTLAALVVNKGNTLKNINVTFAGNIALTKAWTPIRVDGYNGTEIITINGDNYTITGLTAPLFSGGFAGKSGIVIKNLTIADSTIVSTNETGSGAFIEAVDSMPLITLDDCHLVDSSLSGSRTGGLIGWTSGYNNVNDGPVKTYITIKNCSVTDCTITGAGTVGGINGHAGANAWTWTTIENCSVTGCTLTSNDDSYRVGVVLGTANIGEVTISGITESENTLLQNNAGTEIVRPEGQSNLYGRTSFGSTGKLTIDGVAIQ